jgi:nucleotide-binding universal stress UspA family protein
MGFQYDGDGRLWTDTDPVPATQILTRDDSFGPGGASRGEIEVANDAEPHPGSDSRPISRRPIGGDYVKSPAWTDYRLPANVRFFSTNHADRAAFAEMLRDASLGDMLARDRPLSALGIQWQTVLVRGDPRTALLAETVRRRADLLAVGTHTDGPASRTRWSAALPRGSFKARPAMFWWPGRSGVI